MGPARDAAKAARRPALRQRLSVRRHLSGARRRRGARACPMPTPTRCNSISTKSRATSPRAPTLCCCSIAPDGTPPASSTCPTTSRRSSCLRARPELNPVENIWQYLRANWLSNTVFENYDAIIDAACDAWRKLIAQPETITSIGMRDWAHVGQPL